MTTFLDILTEIKDLIIAGLPVFNEGYAYCRRDITKGLVVTAGNEQKYVSITDIEGDYFYIRSNNPISSTVAKSKTDCSVAIAQKFSCSLIAVVIEADEFKLTDAIVNILLKTKVIEVKSVLLDPVSIIDQEFKGMDAESIEKAKSRIGERCIVRVDFDITRNFETHNCEYNICISC